MERRREVRFTTCQPVRLTVLGAEPSGSRDTRYTGFILDYSGRGIRVQIPGKIVVGAAVRVDIDDEILLGEACYCQAVEGGAIVGLELEQSLGHLSDLNRLMRALMGNLPVPA